MAETPTTGVSEIVNAPVPTDPGAAATLRAQLVSDAEYMKDWKTSEDKQARLAQLKWIADGLPAAEWGQSETMDNLQTELDARAVAQMREHASVLAKNGYSVESQIEIIGQRPVPQEEHDFHETQYNLHRRDAAFMARWSAGDMEAIKIMRDHAIGKSLPIGTLEQIKAWEGE